MAEYIERDKAIEGVRSDPMGGLNYKRILMDIPAADVVQVVRCKECKHWDNGKLSFECPWDYGRYGSSDEDDFCSYGERKE